MSGSLLVGKVAIVTGGCSGIGLAAVERFAAEGARVVVADIDDASGDEVAARLGADVVFQHTDVMDEAAVEELVDRAVVEFGRLDVMYNNAGAQGDPSSLLDVGSEGFDRTVALLTRSVVLGHRFAARRFIAQGGGGSIVSTASAAGLQGGWSAAGYTVAKHAVIGVVRQAVAELAPHGIRSNAIAPGVIATPIMARSFGVPLAQATEFSAFLSERLASTQPLQRLGTPEDVAGVALFLASDLSAYVTGAVVPVDGGATAVTQGSFAADVVAAAGDFAHH